MNEIDLIQDLAARALPTPSLEAWPATEILADLLVARGVFTPPKWKGERFNAKDPATREAQRERGRDKLRRMFVTAARTWAIRINGARNHRNSTSPTSFRETSRGTLRLSIKMID